MNTIGTASDATTNAQRPRPVRSNQTSNAPFDPALYGVIALGLGFLFSFAYFMVIATVADEIDWRVEILLPCVVSTLPPASPEITANRDFAIGLNVFGWLVILAIAFAMERFISNVTDRNA